MKTKIDYDNENDIIFFYTGEKSKGSIDIGDFIIDLSKDMRVVAVEILNASENLRTICCRKDINREMISKIEKAELKFIQKRDAITVVLFVSFPNEIEEKFAIQIPIAVRK